MGMRLRGAATTFVMLVAAACLGQQPATGPAGGDAKVQVKVEPEFVTVTVGGRPLLRYRYEKGPKPYIKELYTPGGVQFLLDSPPDHVHHRGLMFAVAVDGVDFWSESADKGRQVHEHITTTPPMPGRDDEMVFLQGVDWRRPGDEHLVTEHRRVDLHRSPEVLATSATLLTWRNILVRSESAGVRLSGNHYFGLGMRFAPGMNKTGRFITAEPNAAGEVVRGDERLYPGRWCAYTASVDGKPVTVAMFDGPENDRPATWFTMADPFAYLSATLRLHKEPLTLEAGEPLYLTYGIAAWDGVVEREQIAKAYELWLALLQKAQPSGQTNWRNLPPAVKEKIKKLP
ncbi:MAG: DUF6807 family protein [Planctomycetota bacterium]